MLFWLTLLKLGFPLIDISIKWFDAQMNMDTVEKLNLCQ